MVLGRDFEQIQGVWTLCSPPLNNSINSFFLCICEQEFFFYKLFLVHRSNFYSNSSFNSSLKKHDGIAISHYVFKLVHLFLVHLLDCFGDISPSTLWTSNFAKLKVTHVFHRPWAGRTEYLFVHRLDGVQILRPRFLSRLMFGRAYLVMRGVLAFSLCRPETFLVHGMADLNKNKNLNKSNMGVMDSHNTMYIT